MSRLTLGVITLLLVGGIVAALVRAQDGSRASHPSIYGTASGSSQLDTSQGVGLARYLQNVGQAVTAEYQGVNPASAIPTLTPPDNDPDGSAPFLLVAANENAAGGLRSVLTRKTTLSDPPEPAAGRAVTPSESAPVAPLAEREPAMIDAAPATPVTSDRGAAGAGQLDASATSPPAQMATDLDSAASLAPPVSNRETSPLETAPAETTLPDGNAASSRRTYRAPATGIQPPLVASRAVSPRKTLSSEEATLSPHADTLSSSTGPLLRVDAIGPRAMVIGEATQLTIRLSNLGTIEAHGASVRIAIPKSLEMVSAEVEDGATRMQQESISGSSLIWTIDQVPPRAERRLMLRVVPRAPEALDLAIEWSVAPAASVARIEVQQPRLELALQGPGELVFGETKVFTVSVSNPGNGDARQVALRLALGDESADMLQVGTIPAGASRQYEVEVTARQAGAMNIVAMAQAANNLQAQAQQQIQVRRADLQIETLGSGLKYAGSVGTYQIRIANRGDASADSVQATLRLPSAAKYVQGLDGVQQQGSDLTWPVGRLAAGEERTYRFFCQVNEEGDARFDFVVRDAGGLEAAGNVLTKVEAIADLKMVVNDPKGPIAVGEEVLYEIQVTNRGTKQATGVQIIAQFSEGIEPSAAEGAKAELVPGQVVFQPIARLNPAETIKLSVKAKADRDGNHVFRAELRCSDPEYRLSAEDTTTFFGDEMISSPVGPAEASPSDEETAPLTGQPSGQPSGWAPSASRR